MGKAVSRCVILSAGPVANATILRGLLRADDVFIAADGGWRLASSLGVTLQMVVADFDSSDDVGLPAEVEVVRLPVRKDMTDTAAAAMYAQQLGFREFLFLGCTGGRLDHQHAAIQLLVQLTQDGCKAMMADEANVITAAMTSPLVVQPMAGWSLSLFAFGDVVKRLSIHNATYELESYDLYPMDSLCVSNAVVDVDCSITFDSGTLLIYRSKD